MTPFLALVLSAFAAFGLVLAYGQVSTLLAEQAKAWTGKAGDDDGKTMDD